MSPRAGFRRQSWISRSASGNRQRFPIDRVAAKPNGKWNRIEPLRSGYKVRNLYCMFTGDDHCAASNDRNSIMRSACGSKSSSSERNFSNIYYAYLHVYLIIDVITNVSFHVERQILILDHLSNLLLSLEIHKNGNHCLSMFSSPSYQHGTSARSADSWRVTRRIRAWINCSTSGSGVVEKKGVEVGRGERGRKGGRGRTRAIETGDR